MVERICQKCGKTYRTFPSIRLKFCGIACSNEGKKNGVHVPCSVCGKRFYKRPCRPHSLFCSKSCARTATNLTDSNPSKHRDITGEKNPMFGVARKGEDNPMFGLRKELCGRWKGGRKMQNQGYVMVVVSDDHPQPSFVSSTGTKYLLEHRFVAEQELGRHLKPNEIVHHIDGDKRNNAIGNLQVFATQSDHMRIGHAPKMTTAMKILYAEVLALREQVASLREELNRSQHHRQG
jgi:hypothetical protein